MKLAKLSGLLFMSLGLTGCLMGSNDDIDKYIASKADTKPKPIPQVKFVETVKKIAFSPTEGKAPFTPPEIEKVTKITDEDCTADQVARELCPDLKRSKQQLEKFDFLDLSMVGTYSQSGSLWALIEDPSGQIHRVRTGYYMGKEYGKIVSITPNRIDLSEFTKNDGKWLKRSRVKLLKVKD